jgi:hypothetical protein
MEWYLGTRTTLNLPYRFVVVVVVVVVIIIIIIITTTNFNCETKAFIGFEH